MSDIDTEGNGAPKFTSSPKRLSLGSVPQHGHMGSVCHPETGNVGCFLIIPGEGN
jgi:hypothetical protein